MHKTIKGLAQLFRDIGAIRCQKACERAIVNKNRSLLIYPCVMELLLQYLLYLNYWTDLESEIDEDINMVHLWIFRNLNMSKSI